MTISEVKVQISFLNFQLWKKLPFKQHTWWKRIKVTRRALCFAFILEWNSKLNCALHS
jgi:hypothetical protein